MRKTHFVRACQFRELKHRKDEKKKHGEGRQEEKDEKKRNGGESSASILIYRIRRCKEQESNHWHNGIELPDEPPTVIALKGEDDEGKKTTQIDRKARYVGQKEPTGLSHKQTCHNSEQHSAFCSAKLREKAHCLADL